MVAVPHNMVHTLSNRSRMFAMLTNGDVVASIMDFTPEIVWHSGIKNAPLERICSMGYRCPNEQCIGERAGEVPDSPWN